MADKQKKVLIIDDSALMRRVVCDIISTDEAFIVADMAADGVEGIELLSRNTYDLVVLDLIMPKLDGIGVLKQIKEKELHVNVVVFSSIVSESGRTTIQALELGALDFIKKPLSLSDAKTEQFIKRFLTIVRNAVQYEEKGSSLSLGLTKAVQELKPVETSKMVHTDGKALAIASSTGGPRALHDLIPRLPKNLGIPVFIVQHMPAGFTASLAQRLDELSQLSVVEAQEGMEVVNNRVYLARGGYHMEIVQNGEKKYIHLSDLPPRESVKPCANYMFESLAKTDYEELICVVLTGMGMDGTVGIQNLSKEKKVFVIAQNQESSVVYGMPRCAVNAGITDRVEPIEKIADTIVSCLD